MLFIILIVIILINLSSSYKVHQLYVHNHHQIHKHHYQLCNNHRHYEIYSSKTDDDINAISNFNPNPNPNPTPSNLNRDYLIAFLIIPLLSLIIPSFLSVVVNSAESLNTRSNYIIVLLVFKRLYVYLIATVR